MAGRIVVGVDGSELGRGALRWAVAEARRRGATLVPVHAWTFVPPPPISEPGLVPMPAGDLSGDLELERDAAARVLEDALAEVDTSGVVVEPLLVEGAAGEAIVDTAADADLIVVGSHGRGAIAGALLGSVSRHVEKHAPCEVKIVRAPEGDEE